ncbi:MAG TPA: ABC transporter ATP-binding protein [Polyangiaceae bacterium]|nr:ABC transporter ATP-binding protein [Polyangiaceae bacterium]
MQTPTEFLISLAARHRGLLLARAALALVGSLVSLVYPWLAGGIAGELLGQGSPAFELQFAFSGLVVLVLVQTGLALLEQWVSARSFTEASFELRTQVYDHLQSLALEQHQATTRGEAMTLLERDTSQAVGFITSTLVGVLPALATLLGAVGMMIYLEPSYGLVTTAVVPLYVIVLRVVRRRLRPLSTGFSTAWARTNTVANEQLSMLPIIKAFGREVDMSERFRSHDSESQGLGRRLYFVTGAIGPASQFVAGVGVVLLLWALSGRVLQGTLAPSEFLVFFMYAFVFTRPLSTLVGVYGATNLTWGSATRIVELLNQPRESAAGGPLRGFERCLCFEHVDFAYPGRPALLRDFSLELMRGTVTAVLGPNGVGKSTLLKLLLGFLVPTRGTLRVDDQDYAQISKSELRQLFAVVPQEMMLLSGSIQENIALGSRAATPELVVRAARLAHADEFIRTLPEGYATRVGEGGILLSGGQRQRIALARALVKEAPVLVLDEATAMLDTATETAFFEACREVFAGRTVIVVGHHLQDLGFADQVVHLDTAGGVRIEREPSRDRGRPVTQEKRVQGGA